MTFSYPADTSRQSNSQIGQEHFFSLTVLLKLFQPKRRRPSPRMRGTQLSGRVEPKFRPATRPAKAALIWITSCVPPTPFEWCFPFTKNLLGSEWNVTLQALLRSRVPVVWPAAWPRSIVRDRSQNGGGSLCSVNTTKTPWHKHRGNDLTPGYLKPWE